MNQTIKNIYNTLKKLTLFFIIFYVSVFLFIGFIGLFAITTIFYDDSDIHYFGWKEKYVEDFGYFKLPLSVQYHQDEETGLVYFTDLYQNIMIAEIDYVPSDGEQIRKHTYTYHNDVCNIQEIEDIDQIVSESYDVHDTVKSKINDKYENVDIFTWNVNGKERIFLFTNEKASIRYGERFPYSFINEEDYLKIYGK